MGVLLRRANKVACRPSAWLAMILFLDAAMIASAAARAMGLVIVTGVIAALAAVMRSRREGALIRVNHRVQRAILRPLPAEFGGVSLACHYRSATEQALVGGDLYDIAMTQYGPRFIIGDVRGKGLDAVGRCATVLAVFRELAFAEPDVVKLAEEMDTRISADMGIEDFVTAILAEFAPGQVRIVNCGHHPPVKAEAGRAELQLMTSGPPVPPLGLHPHPAARDITLRPGDRLLFYTDGLDETRDRAGRFFDLRHQKVAGALAEPDLDAAVGRVVGLLAEHGGERPADDLLLVLAERGASPRLAKARADHAIRSRLFMRRASAAAGRRSAARRPPRRRAPRGPARG